LFSSPAPQHKALTVEDIYGDDGWRRFNGNPHASMNWPPADDPWLDDAHFLWPSADESISPWEKIEAISGKSVPLFPTHQLERALSPAGREAVSDDDLPEIGTRRSAAANAPATADVRLHGKESSAVGSWP
jgi:hypothetical protein